MLTMKSDFHLTTVALAVTVMVAAAVAVRHVGRLQVRNPADDFANLFPRNARFLSLSPNGLQRLPADVDNAGATLRLTLAALRQLLLFFVRHADDTNLDAVLGTRIAEGQLTVLFRNMKSSPGRYLKSNPSKHLRQEVESLALLARDASDKMIANLKQNSDRDYPVIGRLVEDQFWEFDYPTRVTNPNDVYPVVFAEEAMNESESDHCLSEMLGSGVPLIACTISEGCWDLMTKPQFSRYSLTHQIIYLLVGKSMDCSEGMTEKIVEHEQISIERLTQTFCSNVFREMKEHATENFPENRRDLFMEQAAVCGILGYRDPFRKSWLNRILSWQLPHGCYGNTTNSGASVLKKRSRMVKRAERKIGDECLSHRSGVATAALSLYIRFLMEDPALGE